ncbi:type III-A CRISPR-associated protein Cas10/Csm1 [Ligilactobacillus pabuli]|uniref:CRISPR system single-strand-specific deoxyribonuclease Cas10/Csm1 (subtype III-A) n=1 Tax=Ligilactobacillus pabuli TaxID=2886039 RepID=A0ABQ5JEU6_9LACO|nr:type III-A CRISPR-associated protein Cas10/Csm1 [Ligilactobacillus pabuli]GKS80586.1 type III-A CRISPR-associated protein Cas10/Csm1 [Ligilactobacillus pabuli]
MNDKVNQLFFSALLHRIDLVLGQIDDAELKVIYQTSNGREVLEQQQYQKLSDLKKDTDRDNLGYLILFAESLINRENLQEVGRQQTNISNLADIFNKFGNSRTNRSFETQTMDESRRNIFGEEHASFDQDKFKKIQLRLLNDIKQISFEESEKQYLLNLLEKTTSYLSCGIKGQEDISFYDYARLTVGISTAIYLFLQSQEEVDYRTLLTDQQESFYQEKVFQLVSFDISGIQNFIYKITSQGAHKQLRSRSFYLDMISEWMVDKLLRDSNLTRANLLYAGGGHAYLLLPNTKKSTRIIEQIEQSFNQFFLSNFSIDLYVAFGSAEFSPNEMLSIDGIQNIYRKVNHGISNKKLTRYSAQVIEKLNQGGKKVGRECIVCHSVDNLVAGENKCQLCVSLENFSRDIQKDVFFEVTNSMEGLPLDANHSMQKISREEIKNSESRNIIYAKNLFQDHEFSGIKIWNGDYTDLENNLFSNYAQRSWAHKGIKRIAALRCDVDDLGYAFMAGFSEQGQGENNTFSRTATFSRSMSMFFKAYINEFLQENHLTVIYAGGDDVFVLGAWDEVIDFTVLLRQNFRKWTNEKLTLSAGIGLFADKTPINIMARVTGELEDKAKDAGKNRICLFDQHEVFEFDEFIDEIYQEKLPIIRDFFKNENDKGNSFIYKLLELIRQRDNTNRIAFARIAYYLSRLEEVARNKQAFISFKQKMKNWFDSDREIKQVELALILYVYETRKEGQH